MGSTRRTFLQATGCTALVATSGCLERVPFVGDDEGDEDADDSGSSDRDTQKDNGGANHGNEATDSGENGTTQEQESGGGQNNSEEKGGEEEEENEPVERPSEDDTTVDRDQYESPGESETTDRDRDDVEFSADVMLRDGGSNGAAIEWTLTNTSSLPIDAIEIEIVFLNDEGTEVGSYFSTERDLAAGESVTRTDEIEPGSIRGTPVDDKTTITPMDYDSA